MSDAVVYCPLCDYSKYKEWLKETDAFVGAMRTCVMHSTAEFAAAHIMITWETGVTLANKKRAT